MKKILSGLLVTILLICSLATTATSEAYIPSEPEETILTEKLDYYQKRKDDAHIMAEAARNLGYAENSDIIQTAKQEWVEADIKYNYYQQLIEKMNEYPVATTVWIYLQELGYNDYICAGILGNMMVECGGLTLDLDPYIYAGYYGNYYGLCMWYGPYCPGIYDLSVIEQLDYLANDIAYQIDTYGYFYYYGFNYNEFLKITNVYDAALAFCMSYERCYSDSYPHRTVCALEAYQYFVD